MLKFVGTLYAIFGQKLRVKLIGVVTAHDIIHHVADEVRKAFEILVKNIMKPVSACCGLDEPIEDARSKMHEHQTTSLPVVDNAGSCCGTVNAQHLPIEGKEVAAAGL